MKRGDGPLRAAIYARISKDSALQGQGVERQIEDCRKFADLARWTVDERWVLVENDTSATKGPRPKFDRLVHGMRSGAFDVVLVWTLDRLVRTLSDSALIHELLEETGVHLASSDRRIDTTSESGAAQLAIWSALAQIEISNLRARVKRKAQQNLEAGRPTNGGSRPFAWLSDRKTVHEAEAEVVRDVAARVIAGASLTSMCRYLNSRGILTPGKLERGDDNQPTGLVVARSRWDTPRLKNMLSLPRHAGIQTYKGEIQRDDDGKPRRIVWYRQGPDGAPVQGQPGEFPILDDDTRERLLAAIAGRFRTSDNWSTQRRHVLSGFVVCGVCDRPMIATYQGARKDHGPAFVFRCKGHLSRSRDHVERFVMDQVIERAATQRWAIDSWETVDHEATRRKIEEKRRDLADLEGEFLRNGGSAGRLARMTAALDDEIAGLEAGLLRELAMTTGVRWTKIRVDEVLAESASLMPEDEPGTTAKLDRMDLQRNAFQLYAKQVRVFPARRGHGFESQFVQVEWHEGEPFIDSAVVDSDKPFPSHLVEDGVMTYMAEHVQQQPR